jgi:hypothetical protein
MYSMRLQNLSVKCLQMLENSLLTAQNWFVSCGRLQCCGFVQWFVSGGCQVCALVANTVHQDVCLCVQNSCYNEVHLLPYTAS